LNKLDEVHKHVNPVAPSFPGWLAMHAGHVRPHHSSAEIRPEGRGWAGAGCPDSPGERQDLAMRKVRGELAGIKLARVLGAPARRRQAGKG